MSTGPKKRKVTAQQVARWKGRETRKQRQAISEQERELRRFAQQFVGQLVQLRREGRTAEADEITDTLKLANPHLAQIVVREARGKN